MNPSAKSVLRLCLLSLLVLPAAGAAAQPAGKAGPVISSCDKPLIFGFGSWEEAKTAFAVKPDGLHISAKNAQGGAGVAGLNVDVTGYGDWSPTMTLAVSRQNTAGALKLLLIDAGGTSHAYGFDLRKLKPNTPQRLAADYGTSLAEPQSVEKAGKTPGLSHVAVWMVIGDWSAGAVDIVLSGIVLVPPTDESPRRPGEAQGASCQAIRASSPASRGEGQCQEEAFGHRRTAPGGRPRGATRVRRGAGRHRRHLAGRATRQQSTRTLRRRARRRGCGGGKGQAAARGPRRQGGGLLPERALPEGQQPANQGGTALSRRQVGFHRTRDERATAR